MKFDQMTHKQALGLMLTATALWSVAGMVTRHLQSAQGFEITLIRSVFAGLTIIVLWPFLYPDKKLLGALRGGWPLWISGLCWAIMFTCFMVSMTLTAVANVLVAQSIGPVVTALISWAWLKRKLSLRVWIVTLLATLGIACMFILDAQALHGKHLLGFLIAFCIPVAAAINWNVVERYGRGVDFVAAVLVGAVISSLVMLPVAMPFQSNLHDLILLAGLGVFQLGLPCAMCVLAAKHLRAPELSLLGLTEVIFGIALTILFTNETVTQSTLIGGGLVISALVINELITLKQGS